MEHLREPLLSKRRKVTRRRPVQAVSLAPKTRAHLEKMVADEDANSMSAAIDLLVHERIFNAGAVLVRLEPEARQRFIRICMARGKTPVQVLEGIVSDLLAGI